MNNDIEHSDPAQNRRQFMERSLTTAATSGLILATGKNAASGASDSADDTLRVGLIGCGGRGTGAAIQAMNTTGGDTKLVAMADVFENSIQTAYRTIPRQIPETRFRTVTSDHGRWQTELVNVPTCDVATDRFGCSSCCPGMQTLRRTIWCPQPVTQQIPYTVFRTVEQRVPYSVPVLTYKGQVALSRHR